MECWEEDIVSCLIVQYPRSGELRFYLFQTLTYIMMNAQGVQIIVVSDFSGS